MTVLLGLAAEFDHVAELLVARRPRPPRPTVTACSGARRLGVRAASKTVLAKALFSATCSPPCPRNSTKPPLGAPPPLQVYISEAHAVDEWPISSARFNGARGPVAIAQARTQAQRGHWAAKPTRHATTSFSFLPARRQRDGCGNGSAAAAATHP